jgi:hypothetical protein
MGSSTAADGGGGGGGGLASSIKSSPFAVGYDVDALKAAAP